MTINEAKAVDMVSFLSMHGLEPSKIKGTDHWYLSPLRAERTPSFKINRDLNRWYDYGDGKGGNLLDFVLAWKRCTIPDALAFISEQNPVTRATIQTIAKQSSIEVLHTGYVHSPALIRYYRSRRIAEPVAGKYLEEVRYQNGGKLYYALGFKNNAGGYELRTAYFKGSSSPKASTLINNGANQLAVFEGAFDLLSYLSIFSPGTIAKRDFLVLNSASFFEHQLSTMQAYEKVHLYLDNDRKGDKCTLKAIQLDSVKFIDERPLYTGYKDLNEWHQSIGKVKQKDDRSFDRP